MPSTTSKKTAPRASHRLSVSLAEEKLAEIAEKIKVSVAWVVREAIERLLRDEQPLFHVGQE
ncbi:hypothetical protein WNY59_02420 [Ahrensia kielensis]|uniref:Ribbon-helix-helix protein CopG domain-containing protein n=1 Tax=Ahrensia kielensis TaxID=76980 RepID=A0ABU9T2S5_9HYPH